MISLSSDQVMLIAITFLESSTWLLVMLYDPLAAASKSLLAEPEASRNPKPVAKRGAAYPLIAVAQLTKFVLPWGWFLASEGIFDPAYKDSWPNISWLTKEGGDILTWNLELVYSLANNNSRRQYYSKNILLHLAMFSKLNWLNLMTLGFTLQENIG